MTGFEISGHEIILILLAGAVLYAVLALRERRPIRNTLLVLCLAPALFVAVEGGTELLTYDESYMIREVINLERVTLRQWGYGNYRTSIAFTGNMVSILRAPLTNNRSQLIMLAKSIHWLLGIFCLVGIFWTMSQAWIPKKLIAEYFLIYFYGALLLPTNILSMKVANYDMLAMLPGIWGVLCCLIGCEKVRQLESPGPGVDSTTTKTWRARLSDAMWPDGGLTLFGLVLATLAAQEKQIAAPVLNLAIVLSVLMRIRRRGCIDWWVPIQIAICVLVVSLLLALIYGLVAIWHPAQLPRFDLASAWETLLVHFQIVLRAIGVSKPTLPMQGGLLLISIALAPLLWWSGRFVTGTLQKTIRIAFPLFLLLALTLGAVGFYKIQVYMHPAYPVPEGYFFPGKAEEWNGEIIHFLGRTRLEHLLRKTANAYSIFATALPSVFVLVAVLILGSLILKKESAIKGSLLGFEAIALLSLAMPLVYVFTNTPVGVRYFDTWIFTQVLVLGLLGCYLFDKIKPQRVRALALTAFCLLLLLEVLPFRPVVGAFWPWWANASGLPAAQIVEPGKMLPVWPGWGEEAMIAGRKLRSMARTGQLPSKSFRLFTIYQGDWLQPDESTITYTISDAPYLSFTANDYYVITRASLVVGGFNFIQDSKPVWVKEFRGVPEIWVYRGSDLKSPY